MLGMTLVNTIRNLWREEDGQDLIEYSLLLAFVALAAAGLLTSLGTNIGGIFGTANTKLAAANAAAAS